MIKVLHDVLSKEEVNALRKEYESYTDYYTSFMNIAVPGDAVLVIDELMYGYERVGGNYYKHDHPYLPHTDHRKEWENTINVVVPIHTTDPNASLVVFDQQYHEDSVTWCFDHLIEFKVNTGIIGRPCDYNQVTNLSNQPISEDLYEKLKWADRDKWFGLTGQALDFKPGNLLIFDNKNIHATGVLNGTKLGLSLRYKI